MVVVDSVIDGCRSFRINLDGQVAATDVNADGQTLTVGDLVYLIRVIVGDADPIPKLTPHPEELVVTSDRQADVVTVTTDAVSTIGAALLVYDISGDVTPGVPRLGPDAEGMDLQYTIANGELRLLLYNIGKSFVPAGRNRIIEVPIAGQGQLTFKNAEIVDYQGRPYRTSQTEPETPLGFALQQNYPNPFNPSTMISFALPVASEWKLGIYNIAGRLVREFHGFNEAGSVAVEWNGRGADGLTVASGVYLYRLEAIDFSASRKMILLK